MSVRLVWITPNAEQIISYCCRVSNPANQNNPNIEKLLRYCARQKHWSIFEMANMCVEVNTTRAIATQILRHRSFSFQQFCVAEDTYVLIRDIYNNEQYVTIESLYKNRVSYLWKGLIVVYDPLLNDFITCNVKEVYNTGIKVCYSVTTESGRRIQCTKEHRFYTASGYIPLEKIKIGQDKVLIKDDELRYETIKSVELVGERQTYDLEVEHICHNYVANGFVVHNSLRYGKAEELIFPQARRQDPKNRQNSIDDLPAETLQWWEGKVTELYGNIRQVYEEALEKGIAKECARGILPLSTSARLYANGTIRSWIHYLQVRGNPDSGTQKEHYEIACGIKEIFKQELPIIYSSCFDE